MKGNWSIIRQALHRRFSTCRSLTPSSRSSSVRSAILVPNSMSSQFARNSLYPASTIGASIEINFSETAPLRRRSFCSAAGGQNGVITVKSAEEFTNAMSKAQDGSLPSIFYFTAAWCGPCRLLSPVITELSKEYPDVTTFKIDIDESELSNTLSKLHISAVPTLQFFKEGSKKGEIVGADVGKLKSLMEQLYK